MKEEKDDDNTSTTDILYGIGCFILIAIMVYMIVYSVIYGK